jgi:hypothetical protein
LTVRKKRAVPLDASPEVLARDLIDTYRTHRRVVTVCRAYLDLLAKSDGEISELPKP